MASCGNPDKRCREIRFSLCASINGHEKHWDLKLRRIDCKPVLHRPLEITSVPDSYPKDDSVGPFDFRLASPRNSSRTAQSSNITITAVAECVEQELVTA